MLGKNNCHPLRAFGMKSNNEFHLSSKLADPAIVVASFASLATAFLCFASKAISRSLCGSSSPNRTRFAGLRFGFPCPQNWLTLPSLSANFEDIASNAVSSRLSGHKRPEKFFVFPLMTDAVFTQRCGL